MNILLIEDELEMSSIAVAQLTKLGHSVITAHNLRDAYLRYTEHKDTLDLIIGDHRLPDGPGVDFILDISYTEDHAKLAIVSGCLTGTDKRLLEERGIPFYIKPVLYSQVANDFVKKMAPKMDAPILSAEEAHPSVALEMPDAIYSHAQFSNQLEDEEHRAGAEASHSGSFKNKLLSTLTMTDSIEVLESAQAIAAPKKPQHTMSPFGRSEPNPHHIPQPVPSQTQAPIAATSSPAIPATAPKQGTSTTRPMTLRRQSTTPFHDTGRTPPPVAASGSNPAALRPSAPPPGLVKSIGGGPVSASKGPPPPGKPVLASTSLIPPPPPPPEEKPKGLSRLFRFGR